MGMEQLVETEIINAIASAISLAMGAYVIGRWVVPILREFVLTIRDDCWHPSTDTKPEPPKETPVPEEKPVEQTSFTANKPLVDPGPSRESMTTFGEAVFKSQPVDPQEFAILLLYYIARNNPDWQVEPYRAERDVYAFSTLSPHRYDDVRLRMTYNDIIEKSLFLAREDGLLVGRSDHSDGLSRGTQYHVLCSHCKAHHQLNLRWLSMHQSYYLDHAADMARAMLSHRQCRANAILS